MASGFVSVWHWFSQDHAIAAANHSAGQRAADIALRDEAGDLQPSWDSGRLATAIGVPAQPVEDQNTALGDAGWAKAHP